MILFRVVPKERWILEVIREIFPGKVHLQRILKKVSSYLILKKCLTTNFISNCAFVSKKAQLQIAFIRLRGI